MRRLATPGGSSHRSSHDSRAAPERRGALISWASHLQQDTSQGEAKCGALGVEGRPARGGAVPAAAPVWPQGVRDRLGGPAGAPATCVLGPGGAKARGAAAAPRWQATAVAGGAQPRARLNVNGRLARMPLQVPRLRLASATAAPPVGTAWGANRASCLMVGLSVRQGPHGRSPRARRSPRRRGGGHSRVRAIGNGRWRLRAQGHCGPPRPGTPPGAT